MTRRLCFVVLDHRGDRYFHDVVQGLRRFSPGADVYWYDSGSAHDRRCDSDVPRLASSRPLAYAKVTPFFFDLFEWMVDQPYAYVVNVESDLAFINCGYAEFLDETMREADYMAPRFRRATPRTSRWRPYRSLRRELPDLLQVLGVNYTNEAFSPGQVFTPRYAERLLRSPLYGDLRDFVGGNQAPDRSFSLQEVLLPTLPDVLGLRACGYPPGMDAFNRYRPYHARQSVERARQRGDVFLVHPIRRDDRHPARQFVRALTQGQGERDGARDGGDR